ncbi:MAG: ABC transporter ATP-binding protein [Archaeoglobaceae archaeon]|nr:ABC transporter ATP-binding protein [Archaeoglobaceae archaeon]MDW8013607.1 ABC transporter ATP-binding protein [Archaeoglobaceae archaeon]
MLKVENLTKRFGGIIAVNDVSFEIEKGEIVGLIGPNGAGKSTLINLISGFYKPDKGKIVFEGKDITKIEMFKRAKLGIARTFQNSRIVSNMTALMNVLYAIIGRENGENISLHEAYVESIYYLDLFGLLKKRDILASDLPIYELRLLELARALALRPKILLIDEALAGLNPVEAENVSKLINRIKEEFNLTIIWVEHVLKVLMRSVERVLVMHYGKLIADSTPAEVVRNQQVIDAYIGEEAV